MGKAPEKLMLIDGNSILNRAFYGLMNAQMLRTSDGLYTNAVFGFLNIMNMYIDEENPSHICVAFDLGAPTFRHLEYDKYKAKRKKMPEELAMQLPVIKQVLDALNIKRFEIEGFEADDIIGSFAAAGEKEGFDVIIITGDRDALQLASKRTRIKIPSTRGGRTQTREYDESAINKKYGLKPEQLIEVKGLMGDASDNIPGVMGVGEKTALKLIKQYDTLDNVYKNIEIISGKSLKEKLRKDKENAFLSRKLSVIDKNINGICTIRELKKRDFDREKLHEILNRLEFRKFIEKYGLEGTGVEKTVEKEIKCINSLKELKEIKESIGQKGEFALIPVFSDDKDLLGIALSFENDKSIYVDIAGCNFEETFLDIFAPLFVNSKIKKIGHDIKSFIVYLKKAGVKFEGLAFDTMTGAYMLESSRQSYDIPEISRQYLNKNIHSFDEFTGKGAKRKAFSEIDTNMISSTAGMYAETIMKVWKIIDEKIRENKQDNLYYDIELPLTHVLADMEFYGLKIDTAALREYADELKSKIDIITDRIYGIAGKRFNINSPKQLGCILFEELGLPVLKKTKTGYSTSADVLDKLSGKHEIIDCILEYRQLVKLNSTYVEGLMNEADPETGRVHSTFNQTVVVTGRISSTEPNLQNIPNRNELGREIRKVFIPENEKYVFIDADYSQIELRVLAHISRDKNMIEAFRKNEDIHTSTASGIFGVTPDKVTPQMRAEAKAVNFSIVYGIGDYSLSQDLKITRKEARRYIDEYLDRYPGVKRYMKEVVDEAREKGYVTTMFNRKRYVPEISSRNFNLRSFGERVAMNTPIQGTAADIIKIAMVKVHRELEKRRMKSRLILQVHDELMVEAFKDETQEIIGLLRDCMENAVELSVPILADIKKGKNWFEAK